MLCIIAFLFLTDIQVEHLASHFIQGTYMNIETVDTIVYLTTKRGLDIYSLNSTNIPQFIGRLSTDGTTNSVDIEGNYAYLADMYNGLCIFDITDPANPLFVGHYDTDGWTEDVVVVDSIAYLADGNDGLVIVNVADPSQPYYLGSYTQNNYYALSISVSDTLVFLGCFSYDPLLIINVANPQNPYVISQCPQGGQQGDFIWHACIVDTFAYLAGNWYLPGLGLFHFMVYNVADPADPSFVAGVYLEQPASRVVVEGNYAYVNGQWEIRIFDITNPAAPMQTSVIDDAEWYAYRPAVSGTRLVTPEGMDGYSVYDVSNPYLPIKNYHHANTRWQNFAFNDERRHCYLMGRIAGHTNFKFLDITDIFCPVISSDITYLGVSPVIGPGLVVQDTCLAFGLHRSTGDFIGIFNMTDITSPYLVRFENGISSGPSAFHSTRICGGHNDKLMIGDLDGTPLWKDSVPTPGTCYAAAIHDTFAYAVGRNFVSRIDLNSASLITSCGHGHLYAGCMGAIFINFPYLYVNYDASFLGYTADGFMVYDISDPWTIQLIVDTFVLRPVPIIEGVMMYLDPNGCHLQDSLLYLCRDFGGYDIWNVSDPAHPTRILSQETPGSCTHICVRSDTIFVLDRTSIEIYCLTGTGIEESQYTKSADNAQYVRIYPNPFYDRTNIEYGIGITNPVNEHQTAFRIDIYDAVGRLVKTFTSVSSNTGRVVWNGADNNNIRVAQGIYFIKVETQDKIISNKVILLRK